MTVSPSRTHSLFEMLFWRIIPACSYTPLNSRWWILMRKSGVKLKVLSERTFWQKVMKEVLKDLRLEFRGCCHDKEVFEHTKVPLLRPNYKYLSTDVWHWTVFSFAILRIQDNFGNLPLFISEVRWILTHIFNWLLLIKLRKIFQLTYWFSIIYTLY